jgi:plastocyanin
MAVTPRRTHLTILLLSGWLSASAHAANIQITIDKLVYTPAEVSAKVGDTVEWINKDVIAHTATARNGDWDVMIGPSKTVRIVLKKAGAVDYFCKFHPNMKARVTVAP